MEKNFNVRKNDGSVTNIPYNKKFFHQGHTFIVHRPLLSMGNIQSWSISEFTTGMFCCNGKTIDGAVDYFKLGCPKKEELEARINYYINKFGKIN